jgi:membrane fusion protein, multidrug efflux system
MTQLKSLLETAIASVLLVGGTVCAGVGISWYKAYQTRVAQSKPTPAVAPEAVTIVEAKRIEYRHSTTSIGTIVAPRWLSLRSEASGRVAAVHMTSGQIVQEGDLLIELDCSVERASLRAALARLKMHKAAFERISTLGKNGTVSPQELELSVGDFENTQAEVQRLEAIIDRRSLRAPYRAKVGLTNVSLGQYLTEAVEITTLTGIDDFTYVDFTIPQRISGQLRVGQEVKIQNGNEELVGELVAIDTRSDRLTRSLMVRAKLKYPSLVYLPTIQ